MSARTAADSWKGAVLNDPRPTLVVWTPEGVITHRPVAVGIATPPLGVRLWHNKGVAVAWGRPDFSVELAEDVGYHDHRDFAALDRIGYMARHADHIAFGRWCDRAHAAVVELADGLLQDWTADRMDAARTAERLAGL
jgi:hypothetical protein